MKRARLTVYCKGLEVNGDIRDYTDEEYATLVNEIEKAQSGQTDSFSVKNGDVRFFIPRKQLKRSVILIRNMPYNP